MRERERERERDDPTLGVQQELHPSRSHSKTKDWWTLVRTWTLVTKQWNEMQILNKNTLNTLCTAESAVQSLQCIAFGTPIPYLSTCYKFSLNFSQNVALSGFFVCLKTKVCLVLVLLCAKACLQSSRVQVASCVAVFRRR